MSPLKVSFEFFPPKTETMAETLWQSVEKLAPLQPDFVSVTYGAGGSTRDRTHKTVARIVDNTDLAVAAHLTTVDATREEVDEVLRDYWNVGVRHIVALRGDPSAGVGEKYVPTPGGYANAADLAAGAKAIGDFEISVGCYPEKHPESADFQVDIDLLKAKVDAGATRAITQFFYDNDKFEDYLEKVRAAGIDIPIVPGIMPVSSFKALDRMSGLCGTSIPAQMRRIFENLDDDPDTRRLVAATVAAQQCYDLVDRGVTDFHFYTLNRADLSFAVCHMLGLRPNTAAA
ncbi:methylenetetrahydrofolate reductase [NAD(P)H] [Parvularcula sp. LCG005]|uniref:methylenetetrahydrofolate reductase [NAD(P)H] n=1 Tax=Parvularcula sp. LCG005 TaxID=3078805 RepID=UPI002942883C|nr:methylenetetrahydrofolate reductase [NAD(P)H] [Parvularcula sp. LCG005]WOI53843.1 methylenetetrahydrofolate reductase [NAD(P)H] [Parvularcula sp. LCG005]